MNPINSGKRLRGGPGAQRPLRVTLVHHDPEVSAEVARIAAAQHWRFDSYRDRAAALAAFGPLSTDSGEPAASAPVLRVLLLPLRMEGTCGLEWTRRLAALDGQSRAVLLAEHSDAGMGFVAMYAGASALVVLPLVQAELLAAIQAAARGSRFMSPAALQASLDALCCPEPAPSCSSLTRWQVKVLWAMGQGRGEKGASQLLSIPVKTVHAHANQIYPRLGAHALDEALEKVFAGHGCAFACIRNGNRSR